MRWAVAYIIYIGQEKSPVLISRGKNMGSAYCRYFFEIEKQCTFQSFDWLIDAVAAYFNADREAVRRAVQGSINRH